MKFRDIRIKIGTQNDLANLLGIDRSSISKWEKGLAFPRLTVANEIKNVTGFSIDEIYAAIENSRR